MKDTTLVIYQTKQHMFDWFEAEEDETVFSVGDVKTICDIPKGYFTIEEALDEMVKTLSELGEQDYSWSIDEEPFVGEDQSPFITKQQEGIALCT